MNNHGLKLLPEAKAMWLKALQSGDYRQTKHLLCKNSAYCCLGVFARTADIPFVPEGFEELSNREDGDSSLMLFPNATQAETMLPDDWFGAYFVDVDPNNDTSFEDRVHALQTELAQANDGGMTFLAIADWIEENL